MTTSPPYRHAPVALCGVGLSLQTRGAPISVSLATVYNTLHQFTEAGLLRETPSSRGARISTPTRPITIISSVKRPGNCRTFRPVSGLPLPPADTEISRADIVVRTRPGVKIRAE